MGLILYALAAVALLILGAFIHHYLLVSKNPKEKAIVAKLDAVFEKAEAEVVKDAATLAEEAKAAFERAAKAVADAEKAAQAEMDAAGRKLEATRQTNAQAMATIQQAASAAGAPQG